MANTIREWLQNTIDIFKNRDPPMQSYVVTGGSSSRPDRFHFSRGNAKSILTPYYNKIAMDCASIRLEHVRVDDEGNYLETIDSHLNRCLSLNANKDQTSRAFVQDIVMSMFDEGCVALPPIDVYTTQIRGADGRIIVKKDIGSIRTAKILAWYPDYIRIQVYNDRTGQPAEFVIPKSTTPILENPLYTVMNEPNSTVQRLIKTLNLSDTIDAQNCSGKLDMIIQLPYPVKSKARQEMALERKKDIQEQLNSSKYGIAYIDGSEKIIQLNRAIENNLYERVERLMTTAFDQLGITEEIMNGTANESTMQNYYSRSIEPIVSVIIDNMKWKYLTEEQRMNGETIMMFRDPFKIMPITAVADAADKFTRNEIMSPNEWRPIVGRKPVKDKEADELRNRNISKAKDENFATTEENSEQGDE